MKILDLTIHGAPRTAKNGATVARMPNGRVLHLRKPGLVQWEKDALRQITGKHRLRIDYPVSVAVEVWPDANRRADLVGYLQAVLDVLVKAGVLTDDSAQNPAIAVSYDGSRVVGVDKVDPRVRIIITKLDTP